MSQIETATNVDAPCRCKVCSWPLDSVESLLKHYSYHLDDFKTTIVKYPEDDILAVSITSTSPKYKARYEFPSSRRIKPYPQLEPIILDHAPGKPLFDISQSLVDMPVNVNIPSSSLEYHHRTEPQHKRQKHEAKAMEVLRSGDVTGSFNDYLLDAKLLEFQDVSAEDKEFASVWNFFRRRKPKIPDSQTFDAMREFIELNLDHLQNHRQPLLQHLMTLWHHRRIGRDQILECMELYDELLLAKKTQHVDEGNSVDV